MTDKRPRTVRTHGDKMLVDGTLVITLKGTNKPYCKFKPDYHPDLGPHIAIYRVHESGEEDRLLTIGAGGVGSILRWLPMVMAHARRLDNQATRPTPKAKKRG